jgi:hypothetical protein
MIAEFPSNTCTVGASSEARAAMKDARDAIVSACGGVPGSSFVTLRGRATITGVGFFDRIHKQGGVAPNGIELHRYSSKTLRPDRPKLAEQSTGTPLSMPKRSH